jgi:hypothetical protein
MDFVEEEINGEIFIHQISLELSNRVNMELLKICIRSRYDIFAYKLSDDEPPRKYSKDTLRKSEFYGPFGEWSQCYFSKKELEKVGILPSTTADNARKEGLSKVIRESMERSLQATYLIGKWIGESSLQPGEITKAKVQEHLGENGFGFEDSALFKDVWKAIPQIDKSSGGRPPIK